MERLAAAQFVAMKSCIRGHRFFTPSPIQENNFRIKVLMSPVTGLCQRRYMLRDVVWNSKQSSWKGVAKIM
jgi:hypothetical protein